MASKNEPPVISSENNSISSSTVSAQNKTTTLQRTEELVTKRTTSLQPVAATSIDCTNYVTDPIVVAVDCSSSDAKPPLATAKSDDDIDENKQLEATMQPTAAQH